jgi:transcription elongation GreA/GreB family factor
LKSEAGAAVDYAVLRASSIAGRVGRLPARRIVQTDRRLAVEIVIAVARSADSVVTANDDVGSEGVTSAEIAVGIVGRADVLTRGGVVGDLGRGEVSRCRDDDCLDEHFDFV